MALVVAAALVVCGCGGGSSYSPTPTPVAPEGTVSGQYNLVLTSTNGHGKSVIYTDFTQTGKALAGPAKTLACPSNDLSQCAGGNPPAIAVSVSGTVTGADVTLLVSIPATAGIDTVTMAGTAVGTNLAGTYTDSFGDAGTWTAAPAASLGGTYTGTFNSTTHPLLISPTITFTLAQDAKFGLTGTAAITNSPCISSLTLSGDAIGGAFILTDMTNEATIIAVPTGSNMTFSYKFGPSAGSCSGDVGRGQVTSPNPWGY